MAAAGKKDVQLRSVLVTCEQDGWRELIDVIGAADAIVVYSFAEDVRS